jgi:hypothetical protein
MIEWQKTEIHKGEPRAADRGRGVRGAVEDAAADRRQRVAEGTDAGRAEARHQAEAEGTLGGEPLEEFVDIEPLVSASLSQLSGEREISLGPFGQGVDAPKMALDAIEPCQLGGRVVLHGAAG